MIVHMVLLKVKKSVRKPKIAAVMDSIAALSEVVKGMTSFSWGPYSSPEGLNQGFTHAFCSTFRNAKARDAYLVHPAHEAVKADVLAILDGGLDAVIAFDYEE